MIFLILWITSFWTQTVLLNFKENIEKMMWLHLQQFTAHLSVTIKCLTSKAKSSFGRQVGGHTILLRKSKCHKISPLNVLPLKFGVQDNFYVLCQFLASGRFQLTICLKKAFVMWHLNASGLFERIGCWTKISAYRNKNIVYFKKLKS